MEYTNNYNLQMPDKSEFYDISQVNDNIQKIDKALGEKSEKNHTHSFSAITGKPSTYPPDTHNHDSSYYTKNQIDSKLSEPVSWNEISDKPNAYTPASHTHAWSTITGKPSTFSPASHSHDDRYIPKGGFGDFYNIKLGGSDTALVYTQNDDVFFRYKDSSGNVGFESAGNIGTYWNQLRGNVLIWSGKLTSTAVLSKVTVSIPKLSESSVVLVTVAIGEGKRNVLLTRRTSYEKDSFFIDTNYYASVYVAIDWAANKLEMMPRNVKGWGVDTIYVDGVFKII